MIKLLTSIASPTFAYKKGDVVTLDAVTEKNLVRSHQAERVVEPLVIPEPVLTPEPEPEPTLASFNEAPAKKKPAKRG